MKCMRVVVAASSEGWGRGRFSLRRLILLVQGMGGLRRGISLMFSASGCMQQRLEVVVGTIAMQDNISWGASVEVECKYNLLDGHQILSI